MRIGPIPGLRILGSGTCFPSAVAEGALELDNHGVLDCLDLSIDLELLARAATWGVAQRGWLRRPGEPGKTTVIDLAEGAARAALADAGLVPNDVDAILLATSTPAHISSSAAARLGKRLGVEVLTLELRGGGAGALQALVLAATLPAERALVVAAEALSTTLDPTHAASALLYADGAAAVVLGHDSTHPGGLRAAELGTATVPGRSFTIPGTLPPHQADLDAGRYHFQRPDRTYLEGLQQVWARTATRLDEHLEPEAVLVPYPVTKPLIEGVAAQLRLPWDRVAFPLAEHGCVGAAGVLVALDKARRLHPNRPLGLLAVGGGVTWGFITWHPGTMKEGE